MSANFMAKIVGLGGIFFKSSDPISLAAWYEKWLGLQVESAHLSARFLPATIPEDGYAVWAPFPEDTKYFGNGDQPYMVNFMVDDLDDAVSQVIAGGAIIPRDQEQLPFGRFAWFVDPEGNTVELWEPTQCAN